jgi:hypothetical protein
MVESKSCRILAGAVMAALAVGLGGCTDGIYHDGPPIYTRAYYEPPYHYYYYPSVGVYFGIYSGDYYYYSDHHWRQSKMLPPGIYLDRRDRVPLWADRNKPYLKHDEHRQHFKPNPDYHPDKNRDRDERAYDRKRHDESRKK